MPDNAPEADAREFAAQFRSFLDWIHSVNREDNRSEVATLVGGFLGRDGAAQSVVTRELAPFEHVNLQTALDAWSVRPGRTVEVRGLTLPPHHATPTLQQVGVKFGISRERVRQIESRLKRRFKEFLEIEAGDH